MCILFDCVLVCVVLFVDVVVDVCDCFVDVGWY